MEKKPALKLKKDETKADFIRRCIESGVDESEVDRMYEKAKRRRRKK